MKKLLMAIVSISILFLVGCLESTSAITLSSTVIETRLVFTKPIVTENSGIGGLELCSIVAETEGQIVHIVAYYLKNECAMLRSGDRIMLMKCGDNCYQWRGEFAAREAK